MSKKILIPILTAVIIISGWIFIYLKQDNAQAQTIDVLVNANQSLGNYKKFWGNFGSGSIRGETIVGGGAALFNEIGIINQETNNTFRLFRSPNMFGDYKKNDATPYICSNASCSEWHGVYNEDGNGNVSYDWSELDKIYHKIIEKGMKPIVEMSFMPRQLLDAGVCKVSGCGNDWYTNDACICGDNWRNQSGCTRDCVGKWGMALMGPPKDYNKWKNLIRDTIQHLVAEFGKSEVESWHFEVWNEHNYAEFYLTDQEYYQMYHSAVNGATQSLPNIQIGGPAIAGYNMDNYWLNNVLSTGDRATFYTYHMYRKNPDEFFTIGCENFLDDIVDIYSQNGLTYNYDKKIVAGEYGPATTGLQDHDWWRGAFPAAWFIDGINEFFKRLDIYDNNFNAVPSEMMIWASTDNGAHGKGMVTTDIHPGYREIGKRPLFNAIHLAGKLGPQRVNCSSNRVKCFATKYDNGNIQVVMYRINIPDSNDQIGYSQPENSVNLRIEDITLAGSYDVNYYIIDENHSNCENMDSTQDDNLWVQKSKVSGTIFEMTLYPVESNAIHVVTLSQNKTQPNISLTKSSNVSQVEANQDIIYKIDYKNTSPTQASNVIITDNIPAGTTYVQGSANHGGVYLVNPNRITWTFSSMSANTQGSISFGVRVE